MEEVVYLKEGIWKVLSSDKKTWYRVKPTAVNEGIKPCTCISTKFECTHFKKVITKLNMQKVDW